MKATIVSIAFIAVIGFASPAPAQYGPQYSPSATGGGSPGYNHGLRYYRLGKHRHGKKLHAQVKPQAAAPQAPKTTPRKPVARLQNSLWGGPKQLILAA